MKLSKVQWSDKSEEKGGDDFLNYELKKRHKSENLISLGRGKLISGTNLKNGKQQTNELDFINETEEMEKEFDNASPVKRLYKKKSKKKLRKAKSIGNIKRQPMHSPKAQPPKKSKKLRKMKKSKSHTFWCPRPLTQTEYQKMHPEIKTRKKKWYLPTKFSPALTEKQKSNLKMLEKQKKLVEEYTFKDEQPKPKK